MRFARTGLLSSLDAAIDPPLAKNLRLAVSAGGRPPDKNLRLAVSPDSNWLRT